MSLKANAHLFLPECLEWHGPGTRNAELGSHTEQARETLTPAPIWHVCAQAGSGDRRERLRQEGEGLDEEGGLGRKVLRGT